MSGSPGSVAEVARWLRGVLPAGASLVADSRRVARGDAFFAYPGERADGRRHVAQALAHGAAAILLEADAAGGADADAGHDPVPQRRVPGLRRLAGPIADAFHGAPSARLDVVAVTGTNGKTSCSQWIAQGLHAAGRGAAVVGTLGAGRLVDGPAGGPPTVALEDTGLTTPDALSLQALLARFAADGVGAAALEASSIGLHQHRLDGTRIAVAVFTNLTRDHLDYHGTMQAYADAKASLFAWPGLRAAVVNLDDPWHATMLAPIAPGVQRIGYRIGPGDAPGGGAAAGEVHRRLVASSVEPGARGMRIRLDGDWGRAWLESPLLGRFNVSNLLAVAGAWLALGMGFEEVVARLGALRPVPGRLQAIDAGGEHAPGRTGPLAVVDYAHTPDALAAALEALRPVARARGGLLWCVFGAGGERDPGKRPLMGAAAQRGADRVVLTSDNPRGEPPEAILDAIAAGLDAAPALRDADRARAIAETLARAGDADVVLIAGKGHEPYQEIAGARHPFLDAEHAARALARRRAEATDA